MSQPYDYSAPPAGTYVPVTTDDVKPPSKVRPVIGALVIMGAAAIVGLVQAHHDAPQYSTGVYLTYPLTYAFLSAFFAVPAAAAVYLMSWSVYRNRTNTRRLRELSRRSNVRMAMQDEANFAANQQRRDQWIAQVIDAQNAGDPDRARSLIAQAAAYGIVIDEFAVKEYVGRHYRSGAWRDAS